jgi:hypothetical protein
MPTEIIEETPVTETLDEIEGKAQEVEEETTDETPAEDESADDEDIVTIGDPPEETDEEQQTEEAPQWVKELRKSHKKIKAENRELKQQLDKFKPKAVDPGPKPTLESCDYDSDQYESKLSSWYESKRQADEQQRKIQDHQQRQEQEYRQRLENYQEKKRSLKVRNYDDAESTVEEMFDIQQQKIIIDAANNPALVVYALGNNPKRAAEVAAIKNPVRFAYELARLESELKINKRKPKTAPEKTIKGTGSISGTVDSNLDRLRAEAERTGDYSKVMKYKRQKRKAG